MKFTEHISRISHSGRRQRGSSSEFASGHSCPAYLDEDHGDSVETRRRRAEALRACGLLDQSRKYRDGDADSCLERHRSKSLRSDSSTSDERTLFGDGEEHRDTTSECKSSSSSSSVERSPWMLEKKSGIRMRRAGSLISEIDNVPDEESRRLSEVAYLR